MARRNRPPQRYTDFVPVEKMHNEIIPEEMPEGAYGSPTNNVRLGKTTPFEQDQYAISSFSFENRELHQDMPRQYPGGHPTHDDKETDMEQPYNAVQ